jgi:hypothetical protein
MISDPYFVRLGNDVTLSSCSLIGHYGPIKQLYNATGMKVDAVGKIDNKDNCFIGYGDDPSQCYDWPELNRRSGSFRVKGLTIELGGGRCSRSSDRNHRLVTIG